MMQVCVVIVNPFLISVMSAASSLWGGMIEIVGCSSSHDSGHVMMSRCCDRCCYPECHPYQQSELLSHECDTNCSLSQELFHWLTHVEWAAGFQLWLCCKKPTPSISQLSPLKSLCVRPDWICEQSTCFHSSYSHVCDSISQQPCCSQCNVCSVLLTRHH